MEIQVGNEVRLYQNDGWYYSGRISQIENGNALVDYEHVSTSYRLESLTWEVDCACREYLLAPETVLAPSPALV